ncbi:MAG: hypothetical protein E7617_05700 [Ruminococcaceae bacterium]|nr:hypothetical protein [Oscillospiraceae bacterium]
MKRLLKPVSALLLGALLATLVLICIFGFDGFLGLFEHRRNNPDISVVTNSRFDEKYNPYTVADSFALDNGLCYYIFELGTVDYVPMNISGADGVLFNGTEMELTFHYSETNVTESSSMIENTLENSIELTTKTYSKVTVEPKMASVFKAGINTGIENSVSHGITHTYHESFYNSVRNETTFEKTLTYRMNRDDPKGYYFYTPVASMKVYEVVVYNTNQKKIEYMFSYSQFSNALPGLYYSSNGFIDYDSFNIEFNENKLPNFEVPSKVVPTEFNVSVDAKGGSSEISSLNCKLGEPYGTLPEASRKGYKLANWVCDGRIVDEDSLVLSTKPVEASWELITSATISVKKELEVSSTYKLSPLDYFITGNNGESGGNNLSINDRFDFDTLKKEGYKLQITVDCDVKHNIGAILGLEYEINFRSNGMVFESIGDGINSTQYIHRHLVSKEVPLNNITGEVDFTISTENVFPLYMKNIQIKLEFTK